jgi:hypothetical protein
VDTPRNIFNNKTIPYPSKDRSWWQKPRHTLLGRALEAFQTGQSTRGCADPRRLTPTKHTAGPLVAIGATPTGFQSSETHYFHQAWHGFLQSDPVTLAGNCHEVESRRQLRSNRN